MKEGYLKVNYASRENNLNYDQKLVAYLLNMANYTLPSGKVLDVACGTGGFKNSFGKFGFEYFGVDIDNHKPEENIFKVDVGSEPFPFAESMFDVVFFKMGIEHLTLGEIAHCLTEIRRVLKPGGAVFILTPNWRWMYDMFYAEYTHQTPFTTESMRTAMEMNGVQCVQVQSFIQLPIVWQYPWMQWVCNVAYLLYPLWPKKKFIKYSKERIVLAYGTRV